jgi:hypothetical protein
MYRRWLLPDLPNGPASSARSPIDLLEVSGIGKKQLEVTMLTQLFITGARRRKCHYLRDYTNTTSEALKH